MLFIIYHPDYRKINQPIHWNIYCYDCDYQYRKNRLVNYWWWSCLGYGFQITFPVFRALQIMKFRRFISISHTITGYISQNSAKWINYILGAMRRTAGSGSGSTRKSGFECRTPLVEATTVLGVRLAVWLSGNTLASINVVALRQTRLVLGWVTVCGRVNHLGM